MAQFRKAIKAAQLLFVSAALVAGATPEKPSGDRSFVIESLRIPDEKAGPAGLEALVVRPSRTGTFPLVILAHGKSSTEAERKNQDRRFYLRAGRRICQARLGHGDRDSSWLWPARRRIRRKHSFVQRSGLPWTSPGGARDIRAAISFLSRQPYVDHSVFWRSGRRLAG
jgi:hypothetical protein